MSGWGSGWEASTADAAGAGDRTPDGSAGRPLPVGDLLEAAISLARRGGRVLIVGGLVVAVIAETVQALLLWWVLGGAVEPLPDPGDPAPAAAELSDLAWRLAAAAVITVLTAGLIWLAASAFATAVLHQSRLGSPTGWRDIRPLLSRAAGPLAVALLIAVTAASATALIAVAPAAWAARTAPAAAVGWLLLGLATAALLVVVVAPRLALTPAAAVLDQQPLRPAIAASRRATRGRYWRVVAALILNTMLTHAVTAVLAAPVAAFAGDPLNQGGLDPRLAILTGIAGAISVAVTAPFTGSLLAVLYADLRDLPQ